MFVQLEQMFVGLQKYIIYCNYCCKGYKLKFPMNTKIRYSTLAASSLWEGLVVLFSGLDILKYVRMCA